MLTATLSDSELVALIAGGDGTALGSLHDRHSRRVLSLARGVLQNRADAEEILQDVFLQVWQQAARFSLARGGVASWLNVMTRTRAIDRFRQRRRRIDTSALEDAAEPVAEEPHARDPLTYASSAILRGAVSALPWSQRIAMELSLYEGLTHAEIADVLGQPLGTIKTRLRSALAKVRAVLASDVSADATSQGGAGFAGHVCKPVLPQVLVDAVRHFAGPRHNSLI